MLQRISKCFDLLKIVTGLVVVMHPVDAFGQAGQARMTEVQGIVYNIYCQNKTDQFDTVDGLVKIGQISEADRSRTVIKSLIECNHNLMGPSFTSSSYNTTHYFFSRIPVSSYGPVRSLEAVHFARPDLRKDVHLLVDLPKAHYLYLNNRLRLEDLKSIPPDTALGSSCTGRTLLRYAMSAGDHPAVLALLDKGADLLAETPSIRGVTDEMIEEDPRYKGAGESHRLRANVGCAARTPVGGAPQTNFIEFYRSRNLVEPLIFTALRNYRLFGFLNMKDGRGWDLAPRGADGLRDLVERVDRIPREAVIVTFHDAGRVLDLKHAHSRRLLEAILKKGGDINATNPKGETLLKMGLSAAMDQDTMVYLSTLGAKLESR